MGAAGLRERLKQSGDRAAGTQLGIELDAVVVAANEADGQHRVQVTAVLVTLERRWLGLNLFLTDGAYDCRALMDKASDAEFSGGGGAPPCRLVSR